MWLGVTLTMKSPQEEGSHRRLRYYNGRADLDALIAEHVRERKERMIVTGNIYLLSVPSDC